MSTPFCVSPPNLAHRTKKHRKTCSKHRSPSLTSRRAHRRGPASLCEGGGAKRRRERYATAAPWHQAKGTFRAPARGTFALGGKSTQKRRSNLRFENPLRAFTRHLSCLSLPRERCAMQSSPKYCIVYASLSAAAFALKCKAIPLYASTQTINRRPLAATYLCRFAAKARFDNRPNPRRVFPKREGRSPPSLVAQGRGIFKGEGRSKLPSPLNGAFGYFCRY